MSDAADGLRELEQLGLLDDSAEDLYEQAPAAYFSSLLDGTLVKVNGTLLQWTAYDRDDLVGRRRFHDLLAPGARIYYETHYAPLLQMQGEVREVAVELLRADGTRLPVLMSSRVVRDPSGAPRLVRTTAFDASERRRYERELLRARADAESRARAALALAHVAEGVVLVSDTGIVEVMNPAAESIFGIPAAAAVGLAAEDSFAGWTTIAERVKVARPGELLPPDVVPVALDGQEQWLAVSAADAGDAVAYTVRDVTAERSLDQFRADVIAVVSHELRTPLTGTLGAAQTLLGRYDQLDQKARMQLVRMIAEQATRLTKILDQILTASQLDNDNWLPEAGDFDAGEVIDTVLEGVASGSRTRVIVDVPDGVRVRADLDRLRQAIANLVDNALKYSTGSLKIAVTASERSARFAVSDDGPGIPTPERERVFEKFFRLDPAQHSGVGGTGLGLYIVRELVGRMGGRVGYLPRARGSTFFVEIPRAPSADD